MAVVTVDVNSSGPFKPPQTRPVVKLYDHRDHNIDRLRRSIALYDWSHVIIIIIIIIIIINVLTKVKLNEEYAAGALYSQLSQLLTFLPCM